MEKNCKELQEVAKLSVLLYTNLCLLHVFISSFIFYLFTHQGNMKLTATMTRLQGENEGLKNESERLRSEVADKGWLIYNDTVGYIKI